MQLFRHANASRREVIKRTFASGISAAAPPHRGLIPAAQVFAQNRGQRLPDLSDLTTPAPLSFSPFLEARTAHKLKAGLYSSRTLERDFREPIYIRLQPSDWIQHGNKNQLPIIEADHALTAICSRNTKGGGKRFRPDKTTRENDKNERINLEANINTGPPAASPTVYVMADVLNLRDQEERREQVECLS